MAKVKKKPTYRNVRRMGDVKPDSDLRTDSGFTNTASQLDRYARQMLREQPNRQYVDSIAISDTYLLVFSFDRAGGSLFDLITIDKQPVLFVEAVLMLFLDESAIGLDTSVTYTPDKSSTSLKGEIVLDDDFVRGSPNQIHSRWHFLQPTGPNRADAGSSAASEATEATATAEFEQPSSLIITGIGTNRHSIIGRGTTCWDATIPGDNRKFIVKDYWRALDRESEADMLKDAVGLSGVDELIGYQEFQVTEDAGRCGYNTICGIRGYNLGNTHPLREMPKKTLDIVQPNPVSLADREV